MRVFLDTNVWASALMGHGLCRDLLDRLMVFHHIVLGEPAREELHRILTDKFGIPAPLWRELSERLDGFEQAPHADPVPGLVLADTSDLPVLSCAVAAQVHVIITGDQELLDLGQAGGVPIRSPRAVWERLPGLPR